MLFNSLDFALFLPLVFFIYWFALNKNLKAQNFFVVIASYVFYGWWDWRFLALIVFSSSVDYLAGIGFSRTDAPGKRRLLLVMSLVVNLGFLGFFKYYNFFLENFIEAFSFFGHPINARGLNIVLPVGISFYTLQTLSYTIDVYRRRLEPTKDIVAFFAFVAFFPQLVAGPIERATNLLPQFLRKRAFEYSKAVDGMRQMLWGLFKKIVIADNCAVYVNDIFTNFDDYSGITLLMGGVLFAFQIYCDFSGYSDIAIGTARLFGFDLMRNFAFPYFSRDIAEFWRRWHISLSTWFRDYLYIPLGGSRGEQWSKIRNTLIVFVVSGFWHGAKWTFIIWGALNALYFLPLLLTNRNRKYTNNVAEGRFLPNFSELLHMGSTFCIVVLAWVFFRSESLHHAIDYLTRMFSFAFFDSPIKDVWAINTGNHVFYLTFALFIFIVTEWVQREKQHALELDHIKISRPLRWTVYYALIIACFFMNGIQQDFIYFQF
jgi:D-alanyl-lipoteichoic acid acyltransferase DltB (MBOAT superfamily)